MSGYTRPGTYASVSALPQAPAPSSQGGITFAVGTAPFGTDAPGAVYWSLKDFETAYGDAATYPGFTGPLFAYLYFRQSGPGGLAKGLQFRRVGPAHATLVLVGSTTTSLTLTATAAYAGTAGNAIAVVVPAAAGGNQIITFTDANGLVETYTVPTATPATSLLAFVNASSAMFTASAATDGGAYTTGTFNPTGGTTGQNATIGSTDINTASALTPNFLVTLDGSMTTAGLMQTAVNGSSANYGKPRVGVAGPSIGTSTATIEANLTTLTGSVGRMCYIAHDGLLITSPATNLPVVVDGFYGAAILCGIKCSSDPAEPATNKPVAAVIGVHTPLVPSDENTLAGDGGTVFTGGYAATGGSALVILDSVTTTLASVSPMWNKLVNVTAVDETVTRLTRWDQINVIGKRGGSKTGQVIASGWTAILKGAVDDDTIDAFGPVQPAQAGNTFTVPLSLTANGETDIVNIPISVS